jgi:hypothetical protein
MHQNQRNEISRRSLFKSGLCALTSIAIGSIIGTRARAADKLAKSAVQYEDRAKKEGTDCDDCIQFIPGRTANAMGTCKIVEGGINPHGHCIAFTPKPRK